MKKQSSVLIGLWFVLLTQVASAAESKTYFGKYEAINESGVIESVERRDLASVDISGVNPQHVYVDDRGVPLAFFNEKGQTISKEEMLEGSHQRAEREAQRGSSGAFFKDGYVRDSDYYGRLSGYQPKAPTDQGSIAAEQTLPIQTQPEITPQEIVSSAPSFGTNLLPTPKTLGGEPVGLSGIKPVEPQKPSQIPDGFILVDGKLVEGAKVKKSVESFSALKALSQSENKANVAEPNLRALVSLEKK